MFAAFLHFSVHVTPWYEHFERPRRKPQRYHCEHEKLVHVRRTMFSSLANLDSSFSTLSSSSLMRVSSGVSNSGVSSSAYSVEVSDSIGSPQLSGLKTMCPTFYLTSPGRRDLACKTRRRSVRSSVQVPMPCQRACLLSGV